MKHFKTISVVKADAFFDFYNSLFRAFNEFRYAKKEEFPF